MENCTGADGQSCTTRSATAPLRTHAFATGSGAPGDLIARGKATVSEGTDTDLYAATKSGVPSGYAVGGDVDFVLTQQDRDGAALTLDGRGRHVGPSSPAYLPIPAIRVSEHRQLGRLSSAMSCTSSSCFPSDGSSRGPWRGSAGTTIAARFRPPRVDGCRVRQARHYQTRAAALD
jgi:hypothetical protein